MALDPICRKAILSEIGTQWNPECKETLQDALWQYDCECVPVKDGDVMRKSHALDPFFQELSWDSGESLFNLIRDLCIAYQRAAFLDGFRFGLHFYEEMQ